MANHPPDRAHIGRSGCRFMSVAMPGSASRVRHLLPDRPG
jgi:hypothetical protein